MNIFEVFRIAIESLLINRLRSILTTIGIIIGVGAVISLISLGRGVETYINQEFESLGATLLEVSSRNPENENRTRIDPLTMRDAELLSNRALAPSIRRIATSYRVFAQVVDNRQQIQLGINGVSANYADVETWDVLLGQFITPDHVTDNARVAVLGLDVVEALYADRSYNAVGERIRVNDRPFEVIGIMTERGGAFGASEDNIVFIPISTAQSRLDNARTNSGSYRVNSLIVDVWREDLITQARAELESYFDAAHNIEQPDQRDYQISSDAGLLSTINRITGILTIFLGLIAGISLLVGGIGIMNIMLVSVTERTREIGLRKAVGANASAILAQFLIESTILSLLGGFMGIGLGYIAAFVGTNLYEQLTMTVDPDTIILATGVSTFVGIFFGYYPARRAARMKPIDALRFE